MHLGRGEGGRELCNVRHLLLHPDLRIYVMSKLKSSSGYLISEIKIISLMQNYFFSALSEQIHTEVPMSRQNLEGKH